MNALLLPVLFFTLVIHVCDSFKILAIFPYNGRSHHILFSSLVEELATRNHEVTVINYFPVKKMPSLRQISIQGNSNDYCNINMDENLKSVPASMFVNFYRAYDMVVAFKEMAEDNCERLMTHDDIRKIMTSGVEFDLVIVEQFVTDCGLAVAFKLNAPVIGITAHVMMPWTYSRLGATNNPAFVPNHMLATGSRPTLWQKIQSAIVNLSVNTYYRHVIQRSNQAIVNKHYPEIPDLEILGRNMSLIMLNQYFPLTGSRLHGGNIVEIGGMHVKEGIEIKDKVRNLLSKYRYIYTGIIIIPRSNQAIVNKHYPEIPDLEILGRNMSLIMLNQYFPLTGSRLHGGNIVEIGGMHVKEGIEIKDNMSLIMLNQYFPLTGSRLHGGNIVEIGGMHVKEGIEIKDKELKDFLDSSENGVVYISFGSVAHSFPAEILKEIKAFIKDVNMRFVWKVDNVTDSAASNNLLLKKWLPQPAILCHPKVKAFVTHSGMLSTTEAIHCGVPVIAVPLFGDQFSNAAAAEEVGLGISLDIYTLDRNTLGDALRTVLQDRYQSKAKELSEMWKDRPLSPMDTAVYWIQYVAKYKGKVNLTPPTVDLNIFQYLMLDVVILLVLPPLAIIWILSKMLANKHKVKSRKTKKN